MVAGWSGLSFVRPNLSSYDAAGLPLTQVDMNIVVRTRLRLRYAATSSAV